MAIQLRLNSRKPGNYAFFCPVTKLHLTIANPVGYTDGISNYILRAIKAKTLIDVDGVVKLDTDESMQKSKPSKKAEKTENVVEEKSKPVESATIQEPEKEDTSSKEAEAAVEEKKSKRGKRAQSNPVDDAKTE